MGCTPCAAARARRLAEAAKPKAFKFTFPEGTVDPTSGKTTKVYRTEIEAKAAATRWGGTWEPITPAST